jgi:hypothetical protein
VTKDEKLGIDFALNNFMAPRLKVTDRKYRVTKDDYKVRVQDIDLFNCTLYFDKSFIDKCIEHVKAGGRRWYE